MEVPVRVCSIPNPRLVCSPQSGDRALFGHTNLCGLIPLFGRIQINTRRRNFFTELSHPMMRSLVRRISVPSQIAEVSS